MAPTPRLNGSQSSRLVYSIFSLVTAGLSHLRRSYGLDNPLEHRLAKRESKAENIVFPILIPVLVLLSGLFAGLTLGYMSLDQTQLNVLSVSGTPEQRKYANKIKPIRQNGHLLLVTLLLANMIVNETLPVIADPVLGGGVQSVVVSTVLIVIFSEIIPQSLFTRYGLYLGAKCAGLTQFLIYAIGVISWPTAKLLDWIVGSNHGIIYRRVELKELILMHASTSPHGGDLNHDTAAIIGATLDLQEKVVAQAMTPLSDVFMISIHDKLDFALLKKIVESGHSRIPVYEEVDVKLNFEAQDSQRQVKIIGILLVKQCVLLDPNDSTPVRNLRLNKVPYIPQNETLLGILDKFQEGRSHIAVVSRFSVEKAKSAKKAVKQTLTQRLKERVGMDGDSSDSSSDSSSDEEEAGDSSSSTSKSKRNSFKKRFRRDKRSKDADKDKEAKLEEGTEKKKSGDTENGGHGAFGISKQEANGPADAVLTKAGANEFLQNFDPAIMPLGIITLEDVLEELIGEEIYDEFDPEGAHGEPMAPHVPATIIATAHPAHPAPAMDKNKLAPALANVRNLSFFRSKSVPPSKRTREPPVLDSTNEKEIAPESVEPEVGNPPKIAVADGTSTPVEATSTSTPLEAMLFDRKRRKNASAATAADAKPSSAAVGGTATPRPRQGPKGKFKSGPIQTSVGAAQAQQEPSSAQPIVTEESGAATADVKAVDAQGTKEATTETVNHDMDAATTHTPREDTL